MLLGWEGTYVILMIPETKLLVIFSSVHGRYEKSADIHPPEG